MSKNKTSKKTNIVSLITETTFSNLNSIENILTDLAEKVDKTTLKDGKKYSEIIAKINAQTKLSKALTDSVNAKCRTAELIMLANRNYRY